ASSRSCAGWESRPRAGRSTRTIHPATRSPPPRAPEGSSALLPAQQWRAMPGPSARVALETTLLLHGVPRDAPLPLYRELCALVQAEGAIPTVIGVVAGEPVIGLDETAFRLLLDAGNVPKLNSANLGLALATGGHGATTVSTTMELAARAGVRVFATGG